MRKKYLLFVAPCTKYYDILVYAHLFGRMHCDSDKASLIMERGKCRREV